jgi:hypothetical protein
MSKLIEALPKKIGGFAAVNEAVSFWDSMHHYRKYNRILREYIYLNRSGHGWDFFHDKRLLRLFSSDKKRNK